MKKKTTCHPPISFCCKEFKESFGRRGQRFSLDPETGFVKEDSGAALHHCPLCNMELDPVVRCAKCRGRVFLSLAWIDNGGRHLCRKCGPIVRMERMQRNELGDAA